MLANVLNDPTEDTARLVLADWPKKHGEEPLGVFVRAGVVASRFNNAESSTPITTPRARRSLL